MNFSMSRTWNETTSLLGRNFGLLAVLAGLFLFLPQGLLYVVFPEAMTQQMQVGIGASMSGEDGSVAFFVASLLLSLIQILGLTAMTALLDQHKRPTVGQAIEIAARRFLTVFACFLIAMVVVLALCVPVLLFVGFDAVMSGDMSGAIGRMMFGALVLLIVLLYLAGRMSVLMAVITLDGVGNPFRALADSWRLTSPAQWRIFGFYLLLLVVALVIMLVVGMVFGAIGAATGSQSVAILLNSVFGAFANVVTVAIGVAIYYQLAGPGTRQLSDAFE